MFEDNTAYIYPRNSGYTFFPIVAVVTNGLYPVPNCPKLLELESQIPHQSCLVHRVQEWDLHTSCSKHLHSDIESLQCHLVDDARTDPISTWHYAFGHPSAERTRHICKCYNLPG